MRSTEGNRAAVTSASRARPRRARLSATMPTFATALRGNGPRRDSLRCSIRSRSPSSTSNSRNGVTNNMKLNLRIWRQKDRNTPGRFVTYEVDGVTPDMSFLEMLDVLNENLQERGEAP